MDAAVAIDTLTSWADRAQAPAAAQDAAAPRSKPASRVFAASTSLNRAIALWRGPIWRLRADAIAIPTSESLRGAADVAGRVLSEAGEQMAVECAAASPCRTGEAVITRGCALPARFVIHTVGPKYSARYHTAAEHALHMCYRSVLSAAKERTLRSLAIGCIYSPKKGYPREEAAHIATRTVRRFLERFGSDLHRVVFVVDSLEDERIYEAVLPLYFPRSEREEEQSSRLLVDRDLGDEFGEPVIPERKIRIGALFQRERDGVDNQIDNAPSDEVCKAEDEDEDEDAAGRKFRTMTSDPDAERLGRLRHAQEDRQRRALLAGADADRQWRKNAASRFHSALLAGSRVLTSSDDDFDDLRAMDFLYLAGVDLSGAPVLAYIAPRLPLTQDLHRVELFVLHTLQSVATRSASGVGSTGNYSVLYVHSVPTEASGAGETAGNQSTAAAAWLSRLLDVFGADKARHQATLRFFYMLTPSMWLKLLVLVAKRSVSDVFYAKIVYLSASSALDNVAPSLRLPQGVYSNSKTDKR